MNDSIWVCIPPRADDDILNDIAEWLKTEEGQRCLKLAENYIDYNFPEEESHE